VVDVVHREAGQLRRSHGGGVERSTDG
jgi:hypothetical protein